MVYGYLNVYVTNIGEEADDERAALLEHVSKDALIEDNMGARTHLFELLDNLKEGDTVYVYSFMRSFSGLRDIVKMFDTIVAEKKARLVSLMDDFDSATERGQIEIETYKKAIPYILADPTYGFYK